MLINMKLRKISNIKPQKCVNKKYESLLVYIHVLNMYGFMKFLYFREN